MVQNTRVLWQKFGNNGLPNYFYEQLSDGFLLKEEKVVAQDEPAKKSGRYRCEIKPCSKRPMKWCSKCNIVCCKDHSALLCQNCAKNI